MALRYGVVLRATPGVERVVAEAEALGFDSAWVYDTPMVHGHALVHLAACTQVTTRICLGTGVTAPRLRNVGDAATGFASLNALAPGRIRMGIGTGNTNRRAFGMPPVTLAELARFIEQFRELTRGGEVTYQEDEHVSQLRFLHAPGIVNTADPIPVIVAAAGPKAAALAGSHGDGLISFGFVVPEVLQELRELAEASRTAAGDDEAARPFYVMTSVHISDDHSRRHDAQARDAVGHIVISLLAYVVQNPSSAGLISPEGQAAARGLGQHRGWPGDDPQRAHQRLYGNYLGRIRADEREFIIPELIDACAISGEASWCRDRLESIEAAGVTDVVIHPVLDPVAELRQFHDVVLSGGAR